MSRANPRFRRPNAKLPTPVNNVYRLKLIGIIGGQETISTFWYRDALAVGTVSDTHFDNLHTAFTDAGGPLSDYASMCTNNWGCQQIIIDSPNNPTVAPRIYNESTGGSLAPPTLPNVVGVTIDRYTNFKGQCGRGRFTMPAVADSKTGGDQLTAPALISYQVVADTLAGTITSGGDTFTAGLYSNGSRINPGPGFADIKLTFPRLLLGTARRRKPGRGK